VEKRLTTRAKGPFKVPAAITKYGVLIFVIDMLSNVTKCSPFNMNEIKNISIVY
jgi:hypothetical protein